MTFRIEPLADHHHLDDFQSGHRALDEWLRLYARHATGQGTRTYLLIDAATQEVAGYFAIAPHLVERDDLPGKVGRGAPLRIPAILLAKLALGQPHHGRGLGAELLLGALRTVLGAARRAGGKLVIVDAVDEEAARFYERHDFVPLPGDARRLVLKLSTVAAALNEPWP